MKDYIIITESAKGTRTDKASYLIYGHLCKTTGRWYIGETSYIDNICDRFGNNGSRYTRFENNRLVHPKFANAINKYGWDNFEHYILEYCTDDNVNDREIYWINFYDSLENGYNATNGGKNGHKLTEENKRKISNPVLMKNENGEILREFQSAKAAAEFLGLYNNSRIIDCCKGFSKTCAGYYWEYKNGRSIRKNKETNTKIKLEDYHTKTRVQQIDLKTKEVICEFPSAKEAGNKLGLSATCIYRCCRNERISSGGYGWRYIL